ncbi:MAG: peptidoglycan DD-metalloendopeptidase family protein [Acidobacteriota bacterium]
MMPIPSRACPDTHRRLLARLAFGAGVCGLAVWAVSVGIAAQTPDRPHTEELSRRASERIRALQREADGLAHRERTLLEELRRLEVDRDLRTAQFEQGEDDLARVQAELAAISARITTLQRVATSQLPNLTSRMVEIYKLGNAGYLRLLLGVNDLHEMGRAYRVVSAMQALDRQRVTEHRRTLVELRNAQAGLEQRRGQLAKIQEDLTVTRAAAIKAATAHADLIGHIDRRRDLAAQLVGELQAAQAKLQQRLTGSGRSETGAGQGPLALPVRPFRGDLDWPVTGKVVTRFGRERNSRFQTAVVNNGIRIAAPAGTPVRAIHDGTVAFAEPFTGFGNLVIVDHGGLAFTMYGHLSSMRVASGARVVRGQTVGTVGLSLEGTPSLYFELRIDAKPVDPLQWLKAR